jgi:hypothetical protein
VGDEVVVGGVVEGEQWLLALDEGVAEALYLAAGGGMGYEYSSGDSCGEEITGCSMLSSRSVDGAGDGR